MISPAGRRLRLIKQTEFVSLQRGTQIMLQAALFAKLLIHLDGKESDRAAPLRLRPVERRVRVAEQRRGIRAVMRIDCDADAHTDGDAMAVDLQIFRHRRQNALGDEICRRLPLVFLHDNRELVAAETRDELAFYGCQKPVRDLAQHEVARGVSKEIVDFLEPVQVDAQDRKTRSRGGRALQHCRKLSRKSRTVGQACQRVVMGHVRDTLGRPLVHEGTRKAHRENGDRGTCNSDRHPCR